MEPGVIFSALSAAVVTLFGWVIKLQHERLADRDRSIEGIKTSHEAAMTALKASHADAIRDLIAQHARETEQKDVTITRLEQKNEALNTIVDRNNDALENVTETQRMVVDLLGTLAPSTATSGSARSDRRE